MREVRRDPRIAHVPFCVISGHPATREKASQLGAIGYLVKPIELEQLSAIIHGVAGTETRT